jgi:hypothetical protein
MKRVRIVQVGDVHFPSRRGTRSIEVADPSFPESVSDAVAPDSLLVTARHAFKEAHECDSIVALCGDLTDFANQEGYEQCVEWLVRLFDVGASGGWSKDRWHVVPGNHDVDRSATNDTRFEMAQTAWADRVAPALIPVSSPRILSVSASPGELIVFGLNSCIGSGESRNLPESIATKLASVVADFDDLASDFDGKWEQLDTPAFNSADLEAVRDCVGSTDPSQVVAVLAHHNLLPQARTRIKLYTEIVNGGAAREWLSGCGKPLLYLHGHTHTDPIEVIEQKRPGRGRLVSVGAPLFVEGFNTIDVYFDATGRPLGCEIRCHRLGPSGAPYCDTSVLVPLFDPRQAPTPLAVQLSQMLPPTTEARFSEITNKLTMTRQDVGDALREAEWRQVIAIGNRDLDEDSWIIRRKPI